MSFLKRLFGSGEEDPNIRMRPLYLAIIEEGRALHWYEQGAVPDTLDGRFDMISSILALTLLRMEAFEELAQESALLTEIFVEDMDAQMREAGIGDVVIAKDMGKVMAMLGGRLGAFRDAFDDGAQLAGAVKRNIFEAEQADEAALAHVVTEMKRFRAVLETCTADDLLAGRIHA